MRPCVHQEVSQPQVPIPAPSVLVDRSPYQAVQPPAAHVPTHKTLEEQFVVKVLLSPPPSFPVPPFIIIDA